MSLEPPTMIKEQKNLLKMPKKKTNHFEDRIHIKQLITNPYISTNRITNLKKKIISTFNQISLRPLNITRTCFLVMW